MAARGNRDTMIVATKVGRLADTAWPLAREHPSRQPRSRLRALQTDYIDLYFAHGDDDPTFPLEETMAAFDELVKAGKVRYVAASNYGAPRLAEALDISEQNGSHRSSRYSPSTTSSSEASTRATLADLCAEARPRLRAVLRPRVRDS